MFILVESGRFMPIRERKTMLGPWTAKSDQVWSALKIKGPRHFLIPKTTLTFFFVSHSNHRFEESRVMQSKRMADFEFMVPIIFGVLET